MKKLVLTIITFTLAALMAWNLNQEKAQVASNPLRTKGIPHEAGKNFIIPHSEQRQGPQTVAKAEDGKSSLLPSHEEKPQLLAQAKTSDAPKRLGANQSIASLHKAPAPEQLINPHVLPSSSLRSVSTPPALLSESAIVWEVDEGLPLPVVLVESGSKLAAPLLNANESIIQEFENGIGSTSTANSELEVTSETWLQAKAKADARYKALYGDGAYNQRAMQALQPSLVK